MESAASGEKRNPCILVMSNWSAHAISEEPKTFATNLASFAAVMLIEFDEVYCIYQGESGFGF